MKKILSLLLAMALCLGTLMALTACGGGDDDTDGADDGVMTYAEFMAAEVGTVCTVETNLQAWQGWWDNKVTVYLQDAEGAYFAYEMACSEEDAAKLQKGARVKVTGEKAEYAGEIEFYGNVSFEFVEGGATYVATPTDVTALIDNEAELIKHQNKLVVFKGLTVTKVEYKDGAASAAESKDDVYVYVKLANGEEHQFCVEKYLTGPETEVYKTAANLKAGDLINVEGFLYWYNGVNTHVTAIETADYAKFMAAGEGTVCTVETYLQAWQGWWDNKITVYLQDRTGAYFAYEMACSEEDAAKLQKGMKIRVTGEKSVYAGEVEFYGNVSFEFVEGGDTFVATPTDVTALIDNEAELIKHQNKLVVFKGLTVTKVEYKDGAASAAESNDDVYVYVKLANGEEHQFCVEKYLTGPETEVYQTAANLKAGDVVDVEGFLYWYNGVNTHVTAITVAE